MKLVGYISENKVFFKELTPSEPFNDTLTPVYTLDESDEAKNDNVHD